FASREGRGAALVAFNHSDEPVAGTLVAPAGPAWEALGLPLPRDGERLVARRHPHGDAASWTREDLLGGWRVELRPFEAVVYLDVRLEAVTIAAAAPPAPRRRAPGDAPARAAAKRRARSRRRGGGSAGA